MMLKFQFPPQDAIADSGSFIIAGSKAYPEASVRGAAGEGLKSILSRTPFLSAGIRRVPGWKYSI